MHDTYALTPRPFPQRIRIERICDGKEAPLTQNQKPKTTTRTSRYMKLLLVGVVLAGGAMASLVEIVDEMRHLKRRALHQPQPPSGEQRG